RLRDAAFEDPSVDREARPACSRMEMMRLSQLLPIAPGTLHGDPETTVTGVSHDSRAVSPGQLYAALPGSNVHGAKFAPALIRSGVDAILTDAAGWELITEAMFGSEDDRAQLASAAELIVDAPRAVLDFGSEIGRT